jgi:hypothetical protein
VDRLADVDAREVDDLARDLGAVAARVALDFLVAAAFLAAVDLFAALDFLVAAAFLAATDLFVPVFFAAGAIAFLPSPIRMSLCLPLLRGLSSLP